MIFYEYFAGRGSFPIGGRKPSTPSSDYLLPVERYCWLYENRLGPILRDYRKGALSKQEVRKIIASICDGREAYKLFHVVDVWKEGKPVDRRILRGDTTLRKLYNEAKRYGWALLYRGMYFVPKEVWEKYKKNYTTANRFEIFRLENLVRVVPYVLIDIDGESPENIKRVVKYLHRLGIYPEVWESASGQGHYHIYVHLVGQVWKVKRKVGEEETIEFKNTLPYASDYRISYILQALREVFEKLGVKYDSISTERAVWMEGIPNPEKGWKASERIWNGRVHRIDKLFEKLRPVWESVYKEKALKQFFPPMNRKNKAGGSGTCEIVSGDHSTVIDYLQDNISTAFRMIDRGYTRMEAEAELRAGWTGDEKQFERAFPKFWSWIEATYKPLKTSPRKPRKHKHFWEYVDAIHEALKEGYTGVREIARHIGAPPSTVSKIFKMVSREQIQASPDEAKAYLRSIQKGGDRLSDEQKETLREKGRARFRRYMEEFLEKVGGKPKFPQKSKGDKEKKRVKDEMLTYKPPTGVQIGSISISPEGISREEDGTRFSPKRKNRHRSGIQDKSKNSGNFANLKPSSFSSSRARTHARTEPVRRSEVKIQFLLYYDGIDIVKIEKPSGGVSASRRHGRPLKGQIPLPGFPFYEEEEERTIDTYAILRARAMWDEGWDDEEDHDPEFPKPPEPLKHEHDPDAYAVLRAVQDEEEQDPGSPEHDDDEAKHIKGELPSEYDDDELLPF